MLGIRKYVFTWIWFIFAGAFFQGCVQIFIEVAKNKDVTFVDAFIFNMNCNVGLLFAMASLYVIAMLFRKKEESIMSKIFSFFTTPEFFLYLFSVLICFLTFIVSRFIGEFWMNALYSVSISAFFSLIFAIVFFYKDVFEEADQYYSFCDETSFTRLVAVNAIRSFIKIPE